MATGDKIAPKKVRAQSNERLDIVDFLRIAGVAQDNAEAVARALLSTPKATAGSLVGERWTGSITANPTSGSDNLVRVDTDVFIGLDSDGKLVLKPAGTTLSASIPGGGGTHQVYLYMQDVAEETAVRRFVAASTPFGETPQAINVTNRQTAALLVLSGATTVQESSIGGVNRSLLHLGSAVNSGGNVTFTPAANMLETVTAPASLPVTSAGTTTGETTVTGAGKTLRDLVNNALHAIARDRWKGSLNFTASAGNNFGAYTEPPGGIDAAFRGKTWVTIGSDAASIYGDINKGAFANDSLALDAAIAQLPADGGVVYIKPGVTLTLAADVTIPANKSVMLWGGNQSSLGSSAATIDMVTFKFVCASSGSICTFAMRNISLVSSSGTATGSFVELHNNRVFFTQDAVMLYQSAYSGAATFLIYYNAAATTGASIWMQSTTISYANLSNATPGGILNCPAAVAMDDIWILNCTFQLGSTFRPVGIQILDLREDLHIVDCDFQAVGTTEAPSNNASTAIRLASTNNTVLQKASRRVHGCTFQGRIANNRNLRGVDIEDAVNVHVTDCDFVDCVRGVKYTATASLDIDLLVQNCLFEGMFEVDVWVVPGVFTLKNIRIEGCIHKNPNAASGHNAFLCDSAGNIEKLILHLNTYMQSNVRLFTGGVMESIRVTNNHFEGTAAPFLPLVIGTQLNTLTDCVIGHNSFHQAVDLTSISNGVAILMQNLTSTLVEITANRFFNCCNGVFAGGSPMDQAIIRIQQTSAQNLNISDNVFSGCATGLSGANARPPQLIEVNSLDRSTDMTASDALTISRNKCAGPLLTQDINPVLLGNGNWRSAVVSENQFVYKRNGLTRLYADFELAGGGTYRSFVFSRNNFHFEGNAGAAFSNFAWNTSAVATIQSMRFQHNTWYCTGTFGFASGFGVQFTGLTINYLIFDDNQGYIEGDAATGTNGKFNYTPATSLTVSSPAQPGAAAYWGNNNQNIGRN